MYFRRKIDDFLIQWKQDPSHKPLIVKGARQIGKTESILHFANEQYSSVYKFCIGQEISNDSK